MELISDRSRRVSVDELNTTQLLAHARKQAVQRKFDDMLIVDVDSHHYENECYDEFLPLIENDVLRQLIMAGRTKGRGQVHTGMTSFQDMGGRVTRYPLRFTEKTGKGGIRDVELAFRWMDALSVDYSCLFPTPLLGIGMHPDVLECVVVPMRQSETVSRLRALIVPRDATRITSSDSIRNFARERLAAYKVPRVIEFRTTLPRTAAGKVQRHLLETT